MIFPNRFSVKLLTVFLLLCIQMDQVNAQGLQLSLFVDQHISCHGNNDGVIQSSATGEWKII